MLLLDIGNTRLKWAQVQNGQLHAAEPRAHRKRPAALLARLPAEAPDTVWISGVMDARTLAQVRQAVLMRWPCTVHMATTEAVRDGLHNAYAEPARLGADRWLAMLGAWAQTRDACVVVDAGTALTVDVIDAGGRHRGGIIAAGLHTSRAALLAATRFATRDAAPPAHAGLGTDTEGCVDQGALLSCLGAIDRAAAAEPRARRFITGGDAARLLPHLGAGWVLQPELVLHGLWHRATLV